MAKVSKRRKGIVDKPHIYLHMPGVWSFNPGNPHRLHQGETGAFVYNCNVSAHNYCRRKMGRR